jgi:hypothetical protein
MAQAIMPVREERFGATSRRDAWWAGPLATFLGLLAFLIYANYIVFFMPGYFEVREDTSDFFRPGNKVLSPYLAPFHSPLIYDAISPHAWFHMARPSWWPSAFPFSSAMLVLIFPAGFRLTCYYYRKAYYRAFWADPPACAVGEPRKTYWGENHWPLLFQNIHRYFLYAALVFIVFLSWDVLQAFRWPTAWDEHGTPTAYTFGMGLGTLLMAVNVVLIAGFTFGCNSLRHLVGGRLNCFSCPNNVAQQRGGYKLWRIVSRFNEHHMEWAWLSLFSVGFIDFYIRMCAAGHWHDIRFF